MVLAYSASCLYYSELSTEVANEGVGGSEGAAAMPAQGGRATQR